MMTTAYHPFLSAKAKARYVEFNEKRAQSWPVPCECTTVETSHGHTFMRVSGPVDGPPLVLLPGGGNHSLMWISNIAALSARYRTYAVDSILDVGRSANTRPIKTVDELTRWLDELFDALQLGNSVQLMGLSHGAWLAANYAQRYPARISKLVLLAPAGWILPLRPAMLLSMMQMLLYPRRYFIRRAYLWSLPDLAASGEAGLKIIDEMTEDLALAFRCFGVRRLTRMLEPTVADDETLRNLGVPTLFIIGEREKIYSCQQALERLKRVAPDVATTVIPGAGHDMTWFKPDLVNRKILGFLDGMSADPRG
jgi:pimeloyl-ACP methyl ester carboxylesterase